MGYFMLGMCAGIIVSGMIYIFLFVKDFVEWEDELQDWMDRDQDDE